MTGEDCYVMRAHVRDVEHLEEVIDRFAIYGQTTSSIVQSVAGAGARRGALRPRYSSGRPAARGHVRAVLDDVDAGAAEAARGLEDRAQVGLEVAQAGAAVDEHEARAGREDEVARGLAAHGAVDDQAVGLRWRPRQSGVQLSAPIHVSRPVV